MTTTLENRHFKIKLETMIRFYVFVTGLVVVTRCYGEAILSLQAKGFLLLVLTLISLFPRLNKITIRDILWLCTGLVVIFHHSQSYPRFFVVVYICSVVSGIILRRNVETMRVLLRILVIFSIITSVVSWVSVIFPNVYSSVVVPFINESGQEEVMKELSAGNLAGLTDHFSRNAYYVVSGILVLLAKIWSEKIGQFGIVGHRKEACLLLFEVITLMAIGKRGHLMFLGLSIYLVSIFLQRSFSRYVVSTIKIITAVAIMGFLVYRYIPSARHTIERFVIESASEDYSNGRYANYALALNLFRKKPLIGIGIGQFSYLTSHGLTRYAYAGVHNDYLQFLCETGVIGFALFIGLGIESLVMAIIALRSIVKSKSYIPANHRFYLIWSVLFQLFVMVYSMTGLPHFDYEINTVYLLACATSNAVSIEIRRSTSADKEVAI